LDSNRETRENISLTDHEAGQQQHSDLGKEKRALGPIDPGQEGATQGNQSPQKNYQIIQNIHMGGRQTRVHVSPEPPCVVNKVGGKKDKEPRRNLARAPGRGENGHLLLIGGGTGKAGL